jgi:hypothetical protein
MMNEAMLAPKKAMKFPTTGWSFDTSTAANKMTAWIKVLIRPTNPNFVN